MPVGKELPRKPLSWCSACCCWSNGIFVEQSSERRWSQERGRPCAQGSPPCASVPPLSPYSLFSNRFSVRLLQEIICIILKLKSRGTIILYKSVPWLKEERSSSQTRWILLSPMWDLFFIALLSFPFLMALPAGQWFRLGQGAHLYGLDILIFMAFCCAFTSIKSMSLPARL